MNTTEDRGISNPQLQEIDDAQTDDLALAKTVWVAHFNAGKEHVRSDPFSLDDSRLIYEVNWHSTVPVIVIAYTKEASGPGWQLNTLSQPGGQVCGSQQFPATTVEKVMFDLNVPPAESKVVGNIWFSEYYIGHV